MINKITIFGCFNQMKKYISGLIMKGLCLIVFACLCVFENSNAMLGDAMSIDGQNKETSSVMGLYDAINNRRMVRDFQDKIVPSEVLKRVIDAGLKAPTYDHLRNWEFVVLQDKKDKENALQFIAKATPAQLEILDRTLVNGTSQQKMYAIAMPRQYSMLYNASHIILPFFKSNPEVMHPSSISSLNPVASIWCVIENIFLAATAEGLACSMRIPVGEEGLDVAKAVNAPDDYLLPCYIGLGYPAEERPAVEQIEYTAEQKIHFGKW